MTPPARSAQTPPPQRRARLRDLDIRSKSKDAIELCVQAQVKGGISGIIAAALITVSFVGRPGWDWIALWAAMIAFLSAYRGATSVRMSTRLADRRGLKYWARWNTLVLGFTGIVWGAMPWLPFDHGDIGAWVIVMLLPACAVSLAAYNLTALPIGSWGMTVPVALSFAVVCLVQIGGLLGVTLAIAIPVYMLVLVVGAHAGNQILVHERRLMHQLRIAASRSRIQAGALSTAFTRLAETQNQLRIANRQLETLATMDSLTGVANRRSFMDKLDAEHGLRSRYGGSFSVILLDLDHFKQVNDRFGHLVGDLVLKTAAQRIRNSLRSTDVLGRYGGEEFAALLPQTKLADAAMVAERVRAELCAEPICIPEGELVVTASIGVAQWRGAREDADGTLGRADAMLYRAKEGGRDRVVLDESTLELAEGEGEA